MNVTLPIDAAEIIALHAANVLNGAQHYPSCIQVRVTSNGTRALPGGVNFPGMLRKLLSPTKTHYLMALAYHWQERMSRGNLVCCGRPMAVLTLIQTIILS